MVTMRVQANPTSTSETKMPFLSLRLHPSPAQPLGQPELLYTSQCKLVARRVVPTEFELTMFVLPVSCICSYINSFATRCRVGLQGGPVGVSGPKGLGLACSGTILVSP